MSFTTRSTMTGMEDIQQRLADLIQEGEGTIERMSNFVAQSTAQRAKNNIKKSIPLGRYYYRENPGRTVRASAPGQAPADDTGFLLRSISFQKYTSGSAFAYVNAFYGADLEFGTDQISPRPFFLPAFEAAIVAGEKRFLDTFGERI